MRIQSDQNSSSISTAQRPAWAHTLAPKRPSLPNVGASAFKACRDRSVLRSVLGVAADLHLADREAGAEPRLEEVVQDLAARRRFVVEEKPRAGAGRECSVPAVCIGTTRDCTGSDQHPPKVARVAKGTTWIAPPLISLQGQRWPPRALPSHHPIHGPHQDHRHPAAAGQRMARSEQVHGVWATHPSNRRPALSGSTTSCCSCCGVRWLRWLCWLNAACDSGSALSNPI